jgi:MscS family membrane protein
MMVGALVLANTVWAETPDSLSPSQTLAAGGVPNPLFVPQSDSPRQLLKDFNFFSTQIDDILSQTDDEDGMDAAAEQRLLTLLGQMAHLIDTSVLPESDRLVRTNAVLCELSDVLDRIKLPPWERIPDAAQVARDQLAFWRIPSTDIALQRIAKGPNTGDWIIHGDTVSAAHRLYRAALTLEPPSPGQPTRLDRYLAYSGPFLTSHVSAVMPAPLNVTLYGQPLWKYLGSLLVLLLLLAAALLVRRLTRYQGDRQEDPNSIGLNLRRLALPLFLVVAIPLALDIVTKDLYLRMLPLDVLDDVLQVLFFAAASWALISAANLVAAILIHRPSVNPLGLDASLLRLSCRLAAYLLAIWIWLEGLQSLGLSLVPLLAGVGVGGLAFALAAKPTLGNLLGGLILFADRPFRVGHSVVIGQHRGTVEEVGLRSTRLRTPDGHVVSLPNDDVCTATIENVSARLNIKRELNIRLAHDTPPETIARALDIIKQLLSVAEDAGREDEELGRPSNRHINSPDLPPRVYFNDLNADSLNILVIYWFAPAEFWDYLAHATWVNLQLVERFHSAGIAFALPAQSIDVKPRAADQADDQDAYPDKPQSGAMRPDVLRLSK